MRRFSDWRSLEMRIFILFFEFQKFLFLFLLLFQVFLKGICDDNLLDL